MCYSLVPNSAISVLNASKMQHVISVNSLIFPLNLLSNPIILQMPFFGAIQCQKGQFHEYLHVGDNNEKPGHDTCNQGLAFDWACRCFTLASEIELSLTYSFKSCLFS